MVMVQKKKDDEPFSRYKFLSVDRETAKKQKKVEATEKRKMVKGNGEESQLEFV